MEEFEFVYIVRSNQPLDMFVNAPHETIKIMRPPYWSGAVDYNDRRRHGESGSHQIVMHRARKGEQV